MPPLPLSHRPAGRQRFLGLALVAAVLLGACGDDDDTTTTPTTERDPASTTTTEARSTTTEATTTTTTEPASDADRITETVLAYETFHQALGNPVDPEAPHVRQQLVDPILTRTLELLRSHAVSGTHYEGTYEIDVRDVSIDGDTATAFTCARDGITRYRADRSVDAPPDETAFEVDFRMQRVDDGWRIAEVTTFQEEPCTIG